MHSLWLTPLSYTPFAHLPFFDHSLLLPAREPALSPPKLRSNLSSTASTKKNNKLTLATLASTALYLTDTLPCTVDNPFPSLSHIHRRNLPPSSCGLLQYSTEPPSSLNRHLRLGLVLLVSPLRGKHKYLLPLKTHLFAFLFRPQQT